MPSLLWTVSQDNQGLPAGAWNCLNAGHKNALIACRRAWLWLLGFIMYAGLLWRYNIVHAHDDGQKYYTSGKNDMHIAVLDAQLLQAQSLQLHKKQSAPIAQQITLTVVQHLQRMLSP